MPVITFTPKGVCARKMSVEYNDEGIVTNASIEGGCNGNLKGIVALIIGLPIKEVISKLDGIKCMGGGRGLTSCPEQLAIGLKEVLK